MRTAPSLPTARLEKASTTPGFRTYCGADHAPPAGRRAYATSQSADLLSCQETWTLLAASTSTSGLNERSGDTSSRATPDQAPLAARERWFISREAELCQTTWAVPSAAVSTRGDWSSSARVAMFS